MKIIKNNLDKIKLPPSSRVPIETSDNLFTHHNIMLVLGKRGSGKSVFITNYLRLLKEESKADRILVISPTIESNQALLDQLGINSGDCFDPDDASTVQNILDIVDEERDDYENYIIKKQKYKELSRLINSDYPIELIDDYLLLEFPDLLPPQSRYGHRPVIHLFVDDCQSSKLFRDKKFLNLAIRHRHLGGMSFNPKVDKELCGSIGLSMYIAIQNLKAQAGGCPRAIRNNCTQMILVGKSKDEKELDDIYSSVAGEVSKEDFMEGYEYATKEPHNSFVIDLNPKSIHKSRFRKNMNEFLIM